MRNEACLGTVAVEAWPTTTARLQQPQSGGQQVRDTQLRLGRLGCPVLTGHIPFTIGPAQERGCPDGSDQGGGGWYGGEGKGPQHDPLVLQRPGLKVSTGQSRGQLKMLKIGKERDVFARQNCSLHPVTAACALLSSVYPTPYVRVCIYIYIHTRIDVHPCVCECIFICIHIALWRLAGETNT